MARGRERHDARMAAVAGLGRELNRRARSKCELCGEGGSLKVVEVLPAPDEPDVDAALMSCARCRPLVEDGRSRDDTATLRFLAEMVWAEVAPVQIVAVRAARALAEQGVDWAQDAVDGLWLDEAIEARL